MKKKVINSTSRNRIWPILIIAFIISSLLIVSTIWFKDTNDSISELLSFVATIIGSIFTAASVLLIYIQIVSQAKKEEFGTLLELYREFYTNTTFSNIFAIVDNDNNVATNEVLEAIILSEPLSFHSDREKINNIKKKYDLEHLASEQQLSNYLNFFDIIGKLVASGNLSKDEVEKVFLYQIDKTLAHPIIIKYILDGSFQGIKHLKNSKVAYFFYGTLLDTKERDKMLDLQDNINPIWSANEPCTLKGYALSSIIDQTDTYIAIEGDANHEVQGVYVQTSSEKYFELIHQIDTYEDVNILYYRKMVLVTLNNSNEHKYCWTYVKKC